MVFINDQYRLIFIENPKSGSTTVYKTLEKILGSCPRKNPEQAHQTCEEIEKEYPDKWKSYLKVSTYRDPYRRFCSAVNYPKHYDSTYNSIETFLKHQNNKCVYCKSQSEFTNGCDMIIKLETIQQDFDRLCKMIGVKSIKLERQNSQDCPKLFFGLKNIFKD